MWGWQRWQPIILLFQYVNYQSHNNTICCHLCHKLSARILSAHRTAPSARRFILVKALDDDPGMVSSPLQTRAKGPKAAPLHRGPVRAAIGNVAHGTAGCPNQKLSFKNPKKINARSTGSAHPRSFTCQGPRRRRCGALDSFRARRLTVVCRSSSQALLRERIFVLTTCSLPHVVVSRVVVSLSFV
jgi:hypothetical protein